MNGTQTLGLISALLAAAAGCNFAAKATGPVTEPGTGGEMGTGGFMYPGAGGRPMRDGGTAGKGDAAPPSLDGACMVVRNPAEPLPPDLLLVLDRSLSMRDAPATGGGSKWSQMTAGVDASIMLTETTIRWGLEFFGNNTGDLCGVSPMVDVAVGPMNAMPIADAITSSGQPGSSTPTATALRAAGEYLRSLTDLNPKFIVLATDGLPTCNPSGLPRNVTIDDSAAAVAEVMAQASMGTPTFVIGIGTSGMAMAAADATLTQMAMAGGYPRAATPAYFPADNTADLTDALAKITGVVAHGCIYPLPATSPVRNPMEIGVYSDGNLIPYDATMTNGWAFTSATPPYTAVQLYGSYCASGTTATIGNLEIALTCIVP